MSTYKIEQRRGHIIFTGKTMIMGNNSFIIDGQSYSLDDPSTVNKLDSGMRAVFWSLCSDKAKDSDLYRNYANELLNKHQINLELISSSRRRKLIINHAPEFASIGELCNTQKYDTWLQELNNFKKERFDQIVKNSNTVKELLNKMALLGYTHTFTLLGTLDFDLFNLIIREAYKTAELLKSLKDLGYKQPFDLICSQELSSLQYLLEHHYNVAEVMKGFVKLGCGDPFTKFSSLPQEQAKFLVENTYNSFEIMQKLKKIGYKDPFTTMFALEPAKLTYLISNVFNSFELMQLFANLGDKTPLTTFLSINTATLVLLMNNVYAAKEIMTALFKKGNHAPLSFLEKLGHEAMLTMFNSVYEYTNRINRGVNLEHEFKPILKSDNDLSPPLKAFIAFVKEKKPNVERLAKLEIGTLLESIQDAHTKKIVNLPVRLDGDLFDLDTLLQLTQDQDGYRINPLSSDKFLLSQLQPAKDIQKQIEQRIDSAEPTTSSSYSYNS